MIKFYQRYLFHHLWIERSQSLLFSVPIHCVSCLLMYSIFSLVVLRSQPKVQLRVSMTTTTTCSAQSSGSSKIPFYYACLQIIPFPVFHPAFSSNSKTSTQRYFHPSPFHLPKLPCHTLPRNLIIFSFNYYYLLLINFYVLSPLERILKTRPIWHCPDVTREEAVRLLQNKKIGVRAIFFVFIYQSCMMIYKKVRYYEPQSAPCMKSP